MRAGYGLGRARYANSDPAGPSGDVIYNHSIDGGVDYNKALSFSRRTTLSFQTGSSAVGDGNGGRLRFRLTGGATLNHEIGRTWVASAGYSRRTLFHETWGQPVFSDALTFGVSGQVSRRLQFMSVGQTAIGEVGASNTPGFSTNAATSTLSYAATRFINLNMTYGYYRYRFDEGVLLPAGAPRTMDRQSIRATVTLWAPLYQRTRRPDAAR